MLLFFSAVFSPCAHMRTSLGLQEFALFRALPTIYLAESGASYIYNLLYQSDGTLAGIYSPMGYASTVFQRTMCHPCSHSRSKEELIMHRVQIAITWLVPVAVTTTKGEASHTTTVAALATSSLVIVVTTLAHWAVSTSFADSDLLWPGPVARLVYYRPMCTGHMRAPDGVLTIRVKQPVVILPLVRIAEHTTNVAILHPAILKEGYITTNMVQKVRRHTQSTS